MAKYFKDIVIFINSCSNCGLEVINIETREIYEGGTMYCKKCRQAMYKIELYPRMWKEYQEGMKK